MPSVETPSLIGKNINYAAKVLSQHNLNLRIIAEKEDADLPEGTIISQTPTKQQKVKPQQSVFCVVSHQTQSAHAPCLINNQIKQVDELLKNEKIRNKSYCLASKYSEGTCIAQIPSAQEPLQYQSMIIYLSASNKKTVVFPSLKGKSVDEVIEFLDKYTIKPSVQHNRLVDKHHHCTNCIVIDQKPLVGSLVDFSKPLPVQLQVNSSARSSI